jgi:hypothetical protein
MWTYWCLQQIVYAIRKVLEVVCKKLIGKSSIKVRLRVGNEVYKPADNCRGITVADTGCSWRGS